MKVILTYTWCNLSFMITKTARLWPIKHIWLSSVQFSRSVVSDSFDPMDYTVHGILQARMLEWVSLSLLQGIFPTRDRTQVSHITFLKFIFGCVASLLLQEGLLQFPRAGLLFAALRGLLPGAGIKPVSPELAGGYLSTVPTGKSCHSFWWKKFSHSEVDESHSNLYMM